MPEVDRSMLFPPRDNFQGMAWDCTECQWEACEPECILRKYMEFEGGDSRDPASNQ